MVRWWSIAYRSLHKFIRAPTYRLHSTWTFIRRLQLLLEKLSLSLYARVVHSHIDRAWLWIDLYCVRAKRPQLTIWPFRPCISASMSVYCIQMCTSIFDAHVSLCALFFCVSFEYVSSRQPNIASHIQSSNIWIASSSTSHCLESDFFYHLSNHHSY